MGSMNVKLTDYTVKVETALNDTVIAWLYEVGGEVAAQAAKGSPVADINGGGLRNSWQYIVDENEGSVTIGSPLEYAVYQEFGTGIYAVNGDGRKTPWVYKSEKDGEFHRTSGSKPHRMLKNAFDKTIPKAEKALENKLKGLK